jgi:hypothetical protein
MERLLWRTAGREWGYRFAMCPTFVDDPYSLQVAIFGDPVVGRRPVCLSGKWISDGGAIPYVATAFQDADHCDNALRPIVHYMTWFPPAELLVGNELVLPDDWGLRVIRHLAEGWGDAFASKSYSPNLFEKLKADDVWVDTADGRIFEFAALTSLKKNDLSICRSTRMGLGSIPLRGSLILISIVVGVGLVLMAWISRRPMP